MRFSSIVQPEANHGKKRGREGMDAAADEAAAGSAVSEATAATAFTDAEGRCLIGRQVRTKSVCCSTPLHWCPPMQAAQQAQPAPHLSCQEGASCPCPCKFMRIAGDGKIISPLTAVMWPTEGQLADHLHPGQWPAGLHWHLFSQ